MALNRLIVSASVGKYRQIIFKSLEIRHLFVFGLSLLVAFTALADQSQSYKKSIDSIATEITNITRDLNRTKSVLKSEQDKLAGIEQNIGQLNKGILSTKTEIATQKNAVEKLQQQITELNKTQAQDKAALAALVRQQYVQGQPNYLKMVLNQENPYAVGRLHNYYDYFSKAQQAKLVEIRSKIAEGKQLKQQQQLVIDELAVKQQQQEKQQQDLDHAKKKRSESINTLNKKVAKGSEKLKELQQDRSRLNNLLKQIAAQAEKLRKLEQQKAQAEVEAELQRQQAQQRKPKTSKKPIVRAPIKGGFAKQRGRLKYPVAGMAKYRYGSRIAESGMRAQGTFFNTQGSQNVSSIFRGGVLFAGYLKGYGLLLIVDHGDDHISLYGHNEVLYKSVGDQVRTNEVVAKSGVSGGLNSAGLYFEIRHNAEPVDPAKWCR